MAASLGSGSGYVPSGTVVEGSASSRDSRTTSSISSSRISKSESSGDEEFFAQIKKSFSVIKLAFCMGDCAAKSTDSEPVCDAEIEFAMDSAGRENLSEVRRLDPLGKSDGTVFTSLDTIAFLARRYLRTGGLEGRLTDFAKVIFDHPLSVENLYHRKLLATEEAGHLRLTVDEKRHWLFGGAPQNQSLLYEAINRFLLGILGGQKELFVLLSSILPDTFVLTSELGIRIQTKEVNYAHLEQLEKTAGQIQREYEGYKKLCKEAIWYLQYVNRAGGHIYPEPAVKDGTPLKLRIVNSRGVHLLLKWTLCEKA